jgi:hypothetical protein
MRKTQKTTAVVGGTIAAVLVGGVAFAYWSTSGSGTGTASTSVGNAAAVSITGNVPDAMYPGDSPQTVTATLKNTDPAQKVHVNGVSAYLTVTPVGTNVCDVSNYSLTGSSGIASNNADADNPVALTFTAVELGKKDSTTPSDTATATGSIQFNNKTSPQDGCKGAAVTINYASN